VKANGFHAGIEKHRVSRANPRTSRRKGGQPKETTAIGLLLRKHACVSRELSAARTQVPRRELDSPIQGGDSSSKSTVSQVVQHLH
jgi:hypothetical protein